MATITLNVGDSVAREFRKTAAMVEGKSKGYLGKAAAEAFLLWIGVKKHGEQAPEAKLLHLLEKGFPMGKADYAREELHER